MKKCYKFLSLMMAIALVSVSFSGCEKKNESEYAESWIEWDEVVDDGSGNQSQGNQSQGNQSQGDKSQSGGKANINQNVAPIADEKYFPKDWLSEREAYEKSHAPYNVAKKLKGTTVKFATWIDHTKSEGANAFNTFEKATGIKVEWVNIPQSEYIPKLASMMASGTAPDVFVENNDFFPSSLNIAQPLNKISTLDMKDPIWDQSVIKESTFGKNVYYINTKYSIWNGGDSVYYNKKAFEDNGILTPQDYIDAGQWTMDNLIKVMQEFKALNTSYTGGAVNPSYFASSMGTSLIYKKDGKFVSGVNDAALTTAFGYYNKMKDQKLLGGTEKGFMDGTCGVYLVGTMGLKKTGFFKAMDPGNIGVAPIPSIDGKNNSYLSAIYRAYGICRGAKNAEGAAYFLRYFLDPLNYDFDSAFLNDDLRDYFINNISGITADKKHFDFTGSGATVFGYAASEKNTWTNSLRNAESAQFSVELQKISNEVNTAVNKCNDIVNSVIAKDK